MEDRKILKVGVSPDIDATHLERGFSVDVKGRLDLRFMARRLGHVPLGLKRLAQEHLNVDMIGMDHLKNDWTVSRLTQTQTNYAADDAIAGIKIFQKLAYGIWKTEKFNNIDEVIEDLENYIDKNFGTTPQSTFVKL